MKLFGFLRPRGEEKLGDENSTAPDGTAAAEAVPKVDFQKTLGRDQVTGLPNRPCFAHLAAAQSQLAARLETRLSLVVLGWDEYEHAHNEAARDAALAVFAARLREKLQRAHDMLGSLGDGLFAVLLPFTDGVGGETVARRLRLLLAAPPQPTVPIAAEPSQGGTQGPPTVPEVVGPPFIAPRFSVGVATYCGKGPLADDALLAVAERAVAFARMSDGERLVRYDVASAADRQAPGAIT